MILDHVGIVVRSLPEGIARWEALFGYRQISPIIENRLQAVRVVFLGREGSLGIKLLEPAGAHSPLAAFAARGGGLHHLCFRCDELRGALSSLVEQGARLLVSPQPGEAFRGHAVAFCMTPGNLNVELIDTEEKVLLPTPN